MAATIGAGAVGSGQAAAQPSPSFGSSSASCAELPSRAVDAAVHRLPAPFPGRDIAWRVYKQGSSMDCSLNWVQVFPEGATGSSPTQILFFDHHRYVNTATPKSTAFTHVSGSAWPGEVTVEFRWLIGDDTTAHPRGHATVHYQLLPFIPPFPIEPLPPQVLR
ncbi:LppP/LprE family lipoprotein [Gordonia phthalatica]|nr:LppP/LprE family lipoprotein [Gordonia phthalatica]